MFLGSSPFISLSSHSTRPAGLVPWTKRAERERAEKGTERNVEWSEGTVHARLFTSSSCPLPSPSSPEGLGSVRTRRWRGERGTKRAEEETRWTEPGKEGNRWNGEAMEAVDRARLLPTYASFRYTSLRLRRRRDGTWVVRSGPDRRRKETVRSGGDVPTTREADEGRDMTAIYLRHFIIIREVNKEMRLWK